VGGRKMEICLGMLAWLGGISLRLWDYSFPLLVSEVVRASNNEQVE